MDAWIIKLIAMIVMFVMIMITGNIPLRSKTFKSNPKVLALAAAFAGGLFLSVGILHLLPEANHDIENALKTDDESSTDEIFPWAFFITVCSFALILFIEKIATKHQHIPSKLDIIQKEDEHNHNYAPYILQVAIGIHAVFEGLAIGIETDTIKVLSIALAVVFHKWAEGLTLGLSFKQAQIELKTSTIMITIQAIMNPIGVGIGWLLSNQGDLISGIFMSISAGTFVYIATLEVIVDEFNTERYRLVKYIFFLVAIGFITSVWFIEQATGA